MLLDTEDLTDLKGYDKQNPTKPYITAVLSVKEYVEEFTVGNGKTYSYSAKKRRSVRSLERYQDIKNVELELNTEYFVSIRAHENEVS